VAKGLVEITIDPEDRRIHVVSLTSEGKKGSRERCRNIINAEEALLKSLSPDEREILRTLLTKVYEALE
jgi:DNA-binding MarR family transcriptional regulator